MFSGLYLSDAFAQSSTVSFDSPKGYLYYSTDSILIQAETSPAQPNTNTSFKILDSSGSLIDQVDTVTNNGGSISYVWSTPSSGLSVGTYTVEVIFADGSSGQQTFEVTSSSSSNQINIQLDKELYQLGEIIIVDGTISPVISGQEIKIRILTPTNKYITGTGASGSPFSASIGTIGFVNWAEQRGDDPEGTYTLITTYGDQLELTNFEMLLVVSPPDTIPPVVVVPNNKAIEVTSNNPSPVTFSVSATDDTDGNLTPTCSHNSGSNFPIGVTTVTCTATDAAGNTDSESFTITVTYDEPIPEPTDEVTIEAAQGSGAPGCEETSSGCFIPNTASVAVGGVVIFSNTDTAAHTFTAGGSDGNTGEFDSSLVMAGSTYEWSPTKSGDVYYYCMVHPWMKGLVIVSGDSIPTPVPAPNSFRLSFNLSDMSIHDVKEDHHFVSLIFDVNVSSTTGILEVTFPRSNFDSIFDGKDDGFIVLSDGNEPKFTEIKTLSQSRTLRIELPAGSEEVEIIGSKLVGSVSNNFPIYGDDYEEELEILSLSTKKSSYETGDTIVITGKVSTSDFSTPITLQVIKDGSRVYISQFSVSLDETFSQTILADDSLWKESGKYTVKATYGEDSKDTSFIYRVRDSTPEPVPDTDYGQEVTIITADGSGAPGCEETVKGCYIPNTATVDVGGVVIFSNTDTAAHTFTSGDPAIPETVQALFDSSLVMAGSTYEWSPTEAGVVDYFCMVHPWMVGTILVGEGTTPPPRPDPPSPGQTTLEIEMEDSVYDINTVAVLNIFLEGKESKNVGIDVVGPTGTTIISRSVNVNPDEDISFEIKIDENFKTGNYIVTATTSDGNRILKDTDHFKVKSQFNSFKITSVKVTDQQGNPSDLNTGENGFIKVNLESNKSIATLVTVNIFDSELTSIGIGSVKTTLSSGTSEIILSFNIPEDTAIGPANIYVNAFSDWPSNGGIPLTNEVSIVEDIQ